MFDLRVKYVSARVSERLSHMLTDRLRARDYTDTARFDLATDAVPLFRRLFNQSSQFPDRLRVVIDLQSQRRIVVQPDAAVFFNDEHSRRLHAAFVAARRLPGFERREQPQRQMPFGRLERLDHPVHDLFARQDIALGRAVLAELVSGPCRGLRTGERRGFAFGVDDGELTSLFGPILRAWIGIRFPDLFDDFFRGNALPERGDRLRCRS